MKSDLKYFVLVFLLVGIIFSSSVLAVDWQKQGNIQFKVEKISPIEYFFGKLFVKFAIVQPSENVQPGDTVYFDSEQYLDCGPCASTAYEPTIQNYIIEVYDPSGHLIEQQSFPNPEDEFWHLKCSDYGRIYYSYEVPQDAEPGRWVIKAKIAVHDVMQITDCIVQIDEGSFTVGEECAQKDIEIKYCVDEDTRVYKPAGSCNYQYTDCSDQYGIQWRCLDGECVEIEECGDGICDKNENEYNCYEDCGKCGDHICSGPETPQNCPEDCYSCGDGICQESEKLFCGKDCAVCGDGECYYYEQWGEEFYCPQDCGGGDNGPNVNDTTCIGICSGQCGEWFMGVKDPICIQMCKIKCAIADFYAKIMFPLLILMGIIGSVLTLGFSRDIFVKKKKGKTDTVGWVISVVLAIAAFILITTYWWLLLIVLFIYFVVRTINPFKR